MNDWKWNFISCVRSYRKSCRELQVWLRGLRKLVSHLPTSTFSITTSMISQHSGTRQNSEGVCIIG